MKRRDEGDRDKVMVALGVMVEEALRKYGGEKQPHFLVLAVRTGKVESVGTIEPAEQRMLFTDILEEIERFLDEVERPH